MAHAWNGKGRVCINQVLLSVSSTHLFHPGFDVMLLPQLSDFCLADIQSVSDLQVGETGFLGIQECLTRNGLPGCVNSNKFMNAMGSELILHWSRGSRPL